MNIIKAVNLVFDYIRRDEDDKVEEVSRALDHLNLEIEEGSFVAVLGHNGSGKSTLAKQINGILLPTEGTVWISEMDTADENLLWEVRKTAGMVFQNPDNQIIGNVVEEDVAFGPEGLGVPGPEIRKRVDTALAAVGMEQYATRAPHMLSGGQKQRIAIAGMLAMQPEVLVLDEATAMLDPRGRREILSIVSRLHREKGITVVMITQYMEEATIANRVAVMADGKLLLEGPPREVFRQTALLRQHRLDIPAMTELKERLNAHGAGLPEDILTVEDMAEAICQSLLKN